MAGYGLTWMLLSWPLTDWEGLSLEQDIVWAEGEWLPGTTLCSQCWVLRWHQSLASAALGTGELVLGLLYSMGTRAGLWPGTGSSVSLDRLDSWAEPWALSQVGSELDVHHQPGCELQCAQIPMLPGSRKSRRSPLAGPPACDPGCMVKVGAQEMSVLTCHTWTCLGSPGLFTLCHFEAFFTS